MAPAVPQNFGSRIGQLVSLLCPMKFNVKFPLPMLVCTMPLNIPERLIDRVESVRVQSPLVVLDSDLIFQLPAVKRTENELFDSISNLH